MADKRSKSTVDLNSKRSSKLSTRPNPNAGTSHRRETQTITSREAAQDGNSQGIRKSAWQSHEGESKLSTTISRPPISTDAKLSINPRASRTVQKPSSPSFRNHQQDNAQDRRLLNSKGQNFMAEKRLSGLSSGSNADSEQAHLLSASMDDVDEDGVETNESGRSPADSLQSSNPADAQAGQEIRDTSDRNVASFLATKDNTKAKGRHGRSKSLHPDAVPDDDDDNSSIHSRSRASIITPEIRRGTHSVNMDELPVVTSKTRSVTGDKFHSDSVHHNTGIRRGGSTRNSDDLDPLKKLKQGLKLKRSYAPSEKTDAVSSTIRRNERRKSLSIGETYELPSHVRASLSRGINSSSKDPKMSTSIDKGMTKKYFLFDDSHHTKEDSYDSSQHRRSHVQSNSSVVRDAHSLPRLSHAPHQRRDGSNSLHDGNLHPLLNLTGSSHPNDNNLVSSSKDVHQHDNRYEEYEAPLTSKNRSQQKRRMNRMEEEKLMQTLFSSFRQVLYLEKNTKFDVEEIKALQALFKVFHHNTRDRTLDRLTFRDVVVRFLGIFDDDLLDRIYYYFDSDHEGSISDTEWVQNMSILLRGSFEQQLKYCFECYDVSGDHEIGRTELQTLLRGCLMTVPGEENDEVDSVRDIVELAIRKLDYDGTGVITLDKFRSACFRDPLLLQSLGPCLPMEKYLRTFMALISDNYTDYSTNYSRPGDPAVNFSSRKISRMKSSHSRRYNSFR